MTRRVYALTLDPRAEFAEDELSAIREALIGSLVAGGVFTEGADTLLVLQGMDVRLVAEADEEPV